MFELQALALVKMLFTGRLQILEDEHLPVKRTITSVCAAWITDQRPDRATFCRNVSHSRCHTGIRIVADYGCWRSSDCYPRGSAGPIRNTAPFIVMPFMSKKPIARSDAEHSGPLSRNSVAAVRPTSSVAAITGGTGSSYSCGCEDMECRSYPFAS